ncbi:hypothetical protein HFC64_02235 [Saccharolobus solfataricus]|uniref:CRISPR type III-B/RAMP module-associated protein Cmr5 n=1 Tax=Saccharolobus solfataricus TaxID=2287 RepID=A0A7S9IGY3_SACSO|nr:hypothetical protein [Saccharolobus solfataricus]QPG48920.1 hypothetical protein HFC64_02235 [Saccharolobus solfataricus]
MSSQDLLDIATRIAISAIKPKPKSNKPEPYVDSSTINSLLSFLQSRRNVNELLLYIMRQAGRDEIDEETGKLLLASLKDRELKDAVNLLGYVKWVYDTLTGLKVNYNNVKGVKTFKELVNILSKV